MCRILALTNQLSELIVAPTLIQFGLLAENGTVIKGDSSGHRDGWGTVCYKDGQIIQSFKKPTDASKDRAYKKTVATISAQMPEISMAHLRKGSVGSVVHENTHPFCLDNWSLCHNGTGLGLYVAKNIIEAHKGKIHIESEGAGQGTSFVVELG